MPADPLLRLVPSCTSGSVLRLETQQIASVLELQPQRKLDLPGAAGAGWAGIDDRRYSLSMTNWVSCTTPMKASASGNTTLIAMNSGPRNFLVFKWPSTVGISGPRKESEWIGSERRRAVIVFPIQALRLRILAS